MDRVRRLKSFYPLRWAGSPGTVTDNGQRPLTGAKVVMTPERGRSYQLITNRDGHFTAEVPPGNYSIRFLLPGANLQ